MKIFHRLIFGAPEGRISREMGFPRRKIQLAPHEALGNPGSCWRRNELPCWVVSSLSLNGGDHLAGTWWWGFQQWTGNRSTWPQRSLPVWYSVSPECHFQEVSRFRKGCRNGNYLSVGLLWLRNWSSDWLDQGALELDVLSDYFLSLRATDHDFGAKYSIESTIVYPTRSQDSRLAAYLGVWHFIRLWTWSFC